MSNIIIPEEKEKSEKIAEIITLKGNSLRMSSLSSAEKMFLFNLLTVNKLYFSDTVDIKEIVEYFCNISVSEKGLLLEKLTDIFKSRTIETLKEVER